LFALNDEDRSIRIHLRRYQTGKQAFYRNFAKTGWYIQPLIFFLRRMDVFIEKGVEFIGCFISALFRLGNNTRYQLQHHQWYMPGLCK
jgi:hypothetical protein